jgi:hypothetical protein
VQLQSVDLRVPDVEAVAGFFEKVWGLTRLDGLARLLEYLPLTTAAMRQAAVFWAQNVSRASRLRMIRRWTTM